MKRLRRPARDLELLVEVPKLEIGLRDLRDDGEKDAPARLASREVLGQRGLGKTPDAAPEVDFPGKTQINVMEIDGCRARLDELRPSAARPICLVRDLGEELRARDAGSRPELLDTRDRRPDVKVVAQGLIDEGLQRFVAEDLPPRLVREGGRLGGPDLAAGLLRNRNRRPLVARTDGAAGGKARSDQEYGDRFHVTRPLPRGPEAFGGPQGPPLG